MSAVFFAQFDADFEAVKTIRNRREFYARMEAQIASLIENMGQVLTPEVIKKLRAQQQRFREKLCWSIHEGNCPALPNKTCPALPSTSTPINTDDDASSSEDDDSDSEQSIVVSKPSKARVVRSEKSRVYYKPRVAARNNNKKPRFHRP